MGRIGEEEGPVGYQPIDSTGVLWDKIGPVDIMPSHNPGRPAL